MSNWQKRLDELCLNKENVEVEFKSGKGGFPGSFWETFSAFANTDGGIIIIGVKEKEGKFIPDGLTLERIQDYRKRFWDSAHNKSCVSVPLLMEHDIEIVPCGDSKSYVMIFHIPRAPFNLRPVYLTHDPINNTYKRNHEGDYRCTEYQVQRMFADAAHSQNPYDARILPNFSFEDLDELTLRQYRQRFKLNYENHAWNNMSDLEFLKRIGAYRIDRQESTEGFTVAGLLMFGKYESITEPACCPWYFVDYREYLGSENQERWSNRIYPDGNWAANLFQFFYRVYPRVTQALPVPFKLESAIRVDETSAHKAVREAMVNMMVHADYFGREGLVIERYADKLQFRNPGTMLVSVTEFFEGGRSICRNPYLQKMFMYLGGGERAGSGADTIVRGCLDNHWCSPIVSENHARDYVCMSLLINAVSVSQNLDDNLREQGSTSQVKGVSTPQEQGSTPQEQGSTPQVKGVSTPQEQGSTPHENKTEWKAWVDKVADYCRTPRSFTELQLLSGLKDRKYFRQKYLIPLLGTVLELTHPDVPRHRNQKYRVLSTSEL
ncbi:MAG: AAA family ATPase [Akkermansiaceae bacterium]|nr:AAA family ATPase [Akkermansiaceae bacterium]